MLIAIGIKLRRIFNYKYSSNAGKSCHGKKGFKNKNKQPQNLLHTEHLGFQPPLPIHKLQQKQKTLQKHLSNRGRKSK